MFSNSQLTVVSPIPHVCIHILQFCIYLALLGLKILLTVDAIGVDVPIGWGAGVCVRVLDLADRLRGGLILMELDPPPRCMAGVLLGVCGAINITNIINFINFFINFRSN